jgi:hypothetical protein
MGSENLILSAKNLGNRKPPTARFKKKLFAFKVNRIFSGGTVDLLTEKIGCASRAHEYFHHLFIYSYDHFVQRRIALMQL